MKKAHIVLILKRNKQRAIRPQANFIKKLNFQVTEQNNIIKDKTFDKNQARFTKGRNGASNSKTLKHNKIRAGQNSSNYYAFLDIKKDLIQLKEMNYSK